MDLFIRFFFKVSISDNHIHSFFFEKKMFKRGKVSHFYGPSVDTTREYHFKNNEEFYRNLPEPIKSDNTYNFDKSCSLGQTIVVKQFSSNDITTMQWKRAILLILCLIAVITSVSVYISKQDTTSLYVAVAATSVAIIIGTAIFTVYKFPWHKQKWIKECKTHKVPVGKDYTDFDNI